MLLKLILFTRIFLVLSEILREPFTIGVPGIGAIDGNTFSINITYGESIYSIVRSFCGTKIKEEYCSLYADIINQYVYGNTYTPSRATSTVEDYTTLRYTIIEFLVNSYHVKKYLEIGCGENRYTFDRIAPIIDKSICVDPFTGGTHKMTSDEFFASNNDTFDVIFIDGLHSAKQVMRDVQNSLRWLKYDGHILLHDCNPQREYEQRFPAPPGEQVFFMVR